MIDNATRDTLLAAGYLLCGYATISALLPNDGQTAQQLTRPYRRILWQALRVVVGIVAWPTIFFTEWFLNRGQLPEDGWVAEMLTWPYGHLLWQALLLVVTIVVWPLVFIREWAAWLLRLRSRPAKPGPGGPGRRHEA